MSNKLTQKEVNMYGFYTLASGLGNAVPKSSPYLCVNFLGDILINAALFVSTN
jgi:hypothetical protein